MIIVDTNVISEPMKPRGDPAVIDWLDRQATETLYLTATSLSELLVGIDLLPAGRRKRGLASSLAELLRQLFGPRILAFDEAAAIASASIVSRARAGGHSISVADAQIAAIAEVHGFVVATRDTGPFKVAGVGILNPWEV